jgi:hypothetical protein
MTSRSRVTAALLALFVPVASGAIAGEADVVGARLVPLASGQYRVEATILHADSGWDHYADAFEVLAPDGTVLITRELLHPHENEQPFTRSTSAFDLPDGLKSVTVRAHDSVHGFGGKLIEIERNP